jgi:hypothetical protein
VNLRTPASSLVLAVALVIGGGPAAQQPAGSSQSSVPPLSLSAAELGIYQRARTLIDWTPKEIEAERSLRKLLPAENQDGLPGILEAVGKKAVALFHDFARIACDEEVSSETNLPNPLASMGALRRNSAIHKFRYIVIPRKAGDALSLEEYRTDAKGNPVDITRRGSLGMITSNFASIWLYFSPADQHGSRFRYLGMQPVQKRECYVVGFAQDPNAARDVTGFRLGKHIAVLLVQGIAWIDEQSYAVVKIKTWLIAPRTDIGLEDEDTVVNYFSVKPAGSESALWVPHNVTVKILYHGTYFRNTHRYSHYKVFRVESTIKPVE